MFERDPGRLLAGSVCRPLRATAGAPSSTRTDGTTTKIRSLRPGATVETVETGNTGETGNTVETGEPRSDSRVWHWNCGVTLR